MLCTPESCCFLRFFIVSDIDQPRVISSSETLDTSSHPRLIEKEIYLEKLRCEQQRYKQIVENGKLEKEKLIKETDLVQVQLELAKAELALKQHMCQVKGVLLDDFKDPAAS